MMQPQTFAGQRACVQRAGTFHDHAVDGNLFSGLHGDDGSDLHLIGINLLKDSVLLDIRVVGADIHQLADVAAALSDRVALEQLADLIEEHNGDGFDIISASGKSGRHRADGCHCHQEVFIEYLSV